MKRTTSTSATTAVLLLTLAGCTSPAAPAPVPSPTATPASPTAEPFVNRKGYPTEPGTFGARAEAAGVWFAWDRYPEPAGAWASGEAQWQCQTFLATTREGDEPDRLLVVLTTQRQAEHPEESPTEAVDAVTTNLRDHCGPFIAVTLAR